MNRRLVAIHIATIAFGLLLALNSGSLAATTLKVGATPVPHAEILEVVKPMLETQGINLKIIEFTDYVRPNLALADGELDANYFQHIPYLEDFSKEHKLDLTWIAKVHIEPMGVYSKKVKSLADLKNGAWIGIPNDTTNGGRALLLLQTAGVIELKKGVGATGSPLDIVKNPKNIRIKELEAAQLPRALDDLDAAVINGNYAMQAGLVPTKNAIAIEGAESPYVNILAVRTQDKDNPALKKLAEALTSKEVREFILKKYSGGVIPVF